MYTVIINITVSLVPSSLAAAFSTTFSDLTSATEEDGRCQAKPPRVMFQCHAFDVCVDGHDNRLVFIQHQHSVPSNRTTSQYVNIPIFVVFCLLFYDDLTL